MHEQTIICRSHGGLSANGKEENNALNDNKNYLGPVMQIIIKTNQGQGTT